MESQLYYYNWLFLLLMKFESLHIMLNRVQKLDEKKAWYYVLDKKAKQYIISLNTNEQLGEDGIDSEGRSLGEYAPFTVNFRRSKGLQVDHIDFHVTGEYWASWKVEVKDDSFIINVDQDRFNELVNELRFSPDHVGLTDFSIESLAQMLKVNYDTYIREQLLD